MTFKSLGLSKPLLKGVKRLGYKLPYPIQLKAIPVILAKKDVLGIAQTGSGKSAAYLLPLLQLWLEEQWEMTSRHIPVLILVPTRELATQVHSVLLELSSELSRRPKSMAIYGGVSINPQMKGMQGVDFLIGTPGRLLDLIDSKALSLSDLKILVLDEADKMLNIGFKEEMDQLLKMMPQKRQNLLFSATLSKEVDLINQMILHEPEVIQIITEAQKIELIDQRAFRVSRE
ncbi:MAG: DEAD/DEAH box helicase, partial [Flavobacteriales bacterium]|nr:DEAD/DEAH box helicase [Flavobacteriales bacterium]